MNGVMTRQTDKRVEVFDDDDAPLLLLLHSDDGSPAAGGAPFFHLFLLSTTPLRAHTHKYTHTHTGIPLLWSSVSGRSGR
jgi:hypothetical protein